MSPFSKLNLDKQKIFIIIGIVCALLAVVVANRYLAQQNQQAQQKMRQELAKQQANQVAVLVAKQDIPRGTEIDSSMLEAKVVPNQYVQPQAVTSLDRISGMMTMANISKGEQVTLSKLAYDKQSAGLAEATPVGKRAITIIVDNISTLAGMLKPGNYVDVVAMLPVPVQGEDGKRTAQLVSAPLFQNVLVLAVGQETRTTAAAKQKARYEKTDKPAAGPSPMVTIALSPQEANLIAFAQEQGKLRLILRSPADSKVEPSQPATWDTLLQQIMPPAPQTQVKEAKPEEPKPVGFIEVYRGLNKEQIPVFK